MASQSRVLWAWAQERCVRGQAGGAGHRTIAARLGRPASTVRGWVRRIVRVADRVLAVNRDDVDPGGKIGV